MDLVKGKEYIYRLPTNSNQEYFLIVECIDTDGFFKITKRADSKDYSFRPNMFQGIPTHVDSTRLIAEYDGEKPYKIKNKYPEYFI